MRHRLFAALLGCLLATSPAQAADLYLSFGLDSGQAKHEMQGLGANAGAEPHFSLNTQSRDYSVEIGKRLNDDLTLGLTLIHSGPQSVDARQNPHLWIAQTGRIATTESLSLLLVGRKTLSRWGDSRIDAGLGLGLSDTTVRLQDRDQTRTAQGTVPQAMASLRGVQSLPGGTDLWIEARYLTSPALRVVFGPDRVIGHETSGWSIGAGISIALK